MDKETLTEYGWIIVSLLLVVVMLSFATPFGKMTMDKTINAVDDIVDRAIDEDTSSIDAPELSLENGILTITPVANATSYQICCGRTLLDTITGTTLDLKEYIDSEGVYVIKVVAISGTGARSPVASIGYRVYDNEER